MDSFALYSSVLGSEAAKYRIEAEHCGQDAKKLATDPENPYFADVPMDAMKQMAQILVDQGQTEKLPDVEKLVPSARDAVTHRSVPLERA